MHDARQNLFFDGTVANRKNSADFAVIADHIGIDHVVHPSGGGDFQAVIPDHVAVIDRLRGARAETVAVVIDAHVIAVDACAERLQDRRNLRVGKAEHLVEADIRRKIRADIEAAGQRVEQNRQHAGHEHPVNDLLRSGFKRFVKRAHIAVGAHQFLEHLLALREDIVGKMIVFVNHHIDAFPQSFRSNDIK